MEGRYGGPKLENRARFLLQTVKAVRVACGSDFIVASRMNVFDVHPYPYGFGVDKDDFFTWDPTEPKQLVKMLVDEGVDLLGLSSSNPYYIYPQWGRPFDAAPVGVPLPDDSQLKIVETCFNYVSTLQAVAGDVPIVGNEYTWLRNFWPNAGAANLAAGRVGFVGQGRSSFAYPDAAHDIMVNGAMDPKKCCVACSRCTQIMRDRGSTGCVIKDNKMFLPIYKAGRDLTKAKEAGDAAAIKAAEQAGATAQDGFAGSCGCVRLYWPPPLGSAAFCADVRRVAGILVFPVPVACFSSRVACRCVKSDIACRILHTRR